MSLFERAGGGKSAGTRLSAHWGPCARWPAYANRLFAGSYGRGGKFGDSRPRWKARPERRRPAACGILGEHRADGRSVDNALIISVSPEDSS